MGAYRVGRAMPDYRIFVLKDGHIKEPGAPTTKRRLRKRGNC